MTTAYPLSSVFTRASKDKVVWTALSATTLLAAIFRYWHLATLPPGYWYDEAHKSLVALEILRGLRAPVYVIDGQGLEAGYFWLLAGWFRLFGPSYFGSRALSALIGTLTIPVTFWAARTLFRRHLRADLLGLFSAGLLSILLWHVHWSRLGLETIAVPFFAAALTGLLAWAWQRKRWWAFALAGATLGLSQYSNPGARVLPLQALAVFLLLAEWQWQAVVSFGLSFLAGALVVYAPLGLFFVQNPELFFNRIAFTSENARAGGLPFYIDSAVKTILSFNFRGDVMARHNLSLRPALDVIASAWMWAGLAGMIRRRAEWRSHLALIAALGINLLPMVFSDGAPGFGRTLGAAPLLVMLPALGVVAVWDWMSRRRWAQAAVAASLCASAALNAYDYFARYPQQPGLFDSFEVGLWQLTQSAARASETGAAYLWLDEPNLEHPTVRLTRELTRGDLRIVNGSTCFAYPAKTNAVTVFGALPQWIPSIQNQFPAAALTDIMHEPEVYRYASVLTVPLGELSATGVSSKVVATFGDSIQLTSIVLPAQPFSPGSTVPIYFRWQAAATPPERYTSFVHLVADGNPLVAGVDGEPCGGWYPTNQWRAGEYVENQLSLGLPPDLLPGHYDLAVGMYNWTTGERLPVVQTANQREPDRAFIAKLAVK